MSHVNIHNIITPTITCISGPLLTACQVALLNQLIDYVKRNPNHGKPPKTAFVVTGNSSIDYMAQIAFQLIGMPEEERASFLPAAEGMNRSFSAGDFEEVINYFRQAGYHVHFVTSSSDMEVGYRAVDGLLNYLHQNNLKLDWVGLDVDGAHQYEVDVLMGLQKEINHVAFTIRVNHDVGNVTNPLIEEVTPTSTRIGGVTGTLLTQALFNQLLAFVEDNAHHGETPKHLLLLSAVNTINEQMVLLDILAEEYAREDRAHCGDLTYRIANSAEEAGNKAMSRVLRYFNQYGYELDMAYLPPDVFNGKSTDDVLSQYVDKPIAWLGLDIPDGLTYLSDKLTALTTSVAHMTYTSHANAYVTPENAQYAHLRHMEQKEQALNLQDGDVHYIQFDGQWYIAQWDAEAEGWVSFEESDGFEGTSMGSTFEASCDLDDIGERIPTREELQYIRELLALAERQAEIVNMVKNTRLKETKGD